MDNIKAFSKSDMLKRVAIWKDLKPNPQMFLDTRLPEHETRPGNDAARMRREKNLETRKNEKKVVNIGFKVVTSTPPEPASPN